MSCQFLNIGIGIWYLLVFFKCNQQDASYTIFFITVNALHVSGGFSAHHQELKKCTHSIGYMPGLLVATAGVGEFPIHLR